MFQEFSIAQLEEESARERREMHYHQAGMHAADYFHDEVESDRHLENMEEHADILFRIEEELRKRYTKVRELIETEKLADLEIPVISLNLDDAWWNMNAIKQETPQTEDQWERYNELDIRATALMMLLIQKRMAATD